MKVNGEVQEERQKKEGEGKEGREEGATWGKGQRKGKKGGEGEREER